MRWQQLPQRKVWLSRQDRGSCLVTPQPAPSATATCRQATSAVDLGGVLQLVQPPFLTDGFPLPKVVLRSISILIGPSITSNEKQNHRPGLRRRAARHLT